MFLIDNAGGGRECLSGSARVEAENESDKQRGEAFPKDPTTLPSKTIFIPS